MVNIEMVKKLVAKYRNTRVLVVGDLMLDRYIHGTVSRISPEAPVPIVKVQRETAAPGGAANVALNIQALGGQAVVAGVVGTDLSGRELMRILAADGIDVTGVISSPDLHTIVKTRILADRQQVVRVDHEDPPESLNGITDQLCSNIRNVSDKVTGVIIEDYSKGVINQKVIDAVIRSAKKNKVPVGLDPKDNEALNLRGITFSTPNLKEAMLAAGLKEAPLSADVLADKNLQAASRILHGKWAPDFLMITLGSHGMYLTSRKSKPCWIPAKAREVFDVSGAGDTVIAATMLSLAAGATPVEAATIANYCAGVVVAKIGTATCTPEELLEYIRTTKV